MPRAPVTILPSADIPEGNFARGENEVHQALFCTAIHRLRTHALLGALQDDPAQSCTLRFLTGLKGNIRRRTQDARINSTCFSIRRVLWIWSRRGPWSDAIVTLAGSTLLRPWPALRHAPARHLLHRQGAVVHLPQGRPLDRLCAIALYRPQGRIPCK